MRELKGVPEDTSPEARTKVIEQIRAMTPSERLRRAFDLSNSVRSLILADLQAKYPQANESEIKKHLFVRLYGREFARTFPDLSLD